jgi:hypothetical protein
LSRVVKYLTSDLQIGFGNRYTKITFTYRLPEKNNYQFTVDCWGNFTAGIRLKNL